MANIAYYQEGYTDGYQDGKEMAKKNIIRGLHQFIREQTEVEADTQFLRGYNHALHDLKDYLEHII